MMSKPHFLLRMEFRYDVHGARCIVPVYVVLETNICQILELHRTSSTFQSYGVNYRRWQLPIINAFALTIHKVQLEAFPCRPLPLV